MLVHKTNAGQLKIYPIFFFLGGGGGEGIPNTTTQNRKYRLWNTPQIKAKKLLYKKEPSTSSISIKLQRIPSNGNLIVNE